MEIQHKMMFVYKLHSILNILFKKTKRSRSLSLSDSRALQMRKQAFNYWVTQINNLEKSLSIYLNNSPHMDANFRRMMEAKFVFDIPIYIS